MVGKAVPPPQARGVQPPRFLPPPPPPLPPPLRWLNHFALKLKCSALATRRRCVGPGCASVLGRERGVWVSAAPPALPAERLRRVPGSEAGLCVPRLAGLGIPAREPLCPVPGELFSLAGPSLTSARAPNHESGGSTEDRGRKEPSYGFSAESEGKE